MNIRILTENDAADFWSLRLEGLETDSEAFFESAEEFRAVPIETVIARLCAPGTDNFVVGAFEDDKLIGTAGFAREQRKKGHHKGRIWGMYVTASARGKGAGRALLESLIRTARTLDGLEQIVLSVTEGQAAARALYRSLGFEVFGQEPNSLHDRGRSISEDYMVLRLK